jgi:hypothetical protein
MALDESSNHSAPFNEEFSRTCENPRGGFRRHGLRNTVLIIGRCFEKEDRSLDVRFQVILNGGNVSVSVRRLEHCLILKHIINGFNNHLYYSFLECDLLLRHALESHPEHLEKWTRYPQFAASDLLSFLFIIVSDRWISSYALKQADDDLSRDERSFSDDHLKKRWNA